MKKYRDEPSTSRTPDMPSFGGVPTAGGLKFGYEQQQPAGLVVNTNTHLAVKESPPSSPSSEASARKRRKPTAQASPHEKEVKIVQNGAAPSTHHMLGNQLNLNSSVAKNMTETLNMEIEAHSIYSHEPAANLVGPQFPGRKDSVRNIEKFLFRWLIFTPFRASNHRQRHRQRPHQAQPHSPQCLAELRHRTERRKVLSNFSSDNGNRDRNFSWSRLSISTVSF